MRHALVALALLALAGCGGGAHDDTWPLPNHDLSSTRATSGSVESLRVAWRFTLHTKPTDAGSMTATPVVDDGTVYVQDMRSDVFALSLETGQVRWTRQFDVPSPGPNGVTVADGRVYGATDEDAFALDASTGRVLWRRLLTSPRELFVDVAPQVDGDTVYVATVGMGENGAGALYALDAASGALRWRTPTVKEPWRVPTEAGGGGAWYPPSVADGVVYWGTANPTPFGGTPAHPNGGAFAGPALYTDSLLALDTAGGHVRWYDQVTPHDVRDHDFQLPPVLTEGLVVGAGKGGRVIAWDTKGRRRWQAVVGLHRNDRGPLPAEPVSVCPGLFGGVETPMAAAKGRIYVPVVDLCSRGSATGYQPVDSVNPTEGRGELVALDAKTGNRLWKRDLPQPDFGCATAIGDAVVTTTFDGELWAFDGKTGRTLRRLALGGGVNGCPAAAGGLLLVPVGVAAEGQAALVGIRLGD